MDVEGRRGVGEGPSLLDPGRQAGCDVAIGSRERSSRRRVADPSRRERQCAEGQQLEGLRDVRRYVGGEVHRSIVGGRSSRTGEGWSMLEESRTPVVEAHDLVMFDLDGVVYVGDAAIDGVAARIDRLRESGTHVAFVTNNASRTPDKVAEKLAKVGVTATAEDVVTSAQAAARVLAEEHGEGARILLLGGEGLRVGARRGRARARRGPGRRRGRGERLRTGRAAGATSCGSRRSCATACPTSPATPT